MPRRKPTSTNAKKAEQQLKRAIKRGDAPPPTDQKPILQKRKPRPRLGPTGQLVGNATSASNSVESSRRLQSSFIKISPTYLAQTKILAATLPLERPIPFISALLPQIDSPSRLGASLNASHNLTCPKRPKWRFDMSKKEVEANEEAQFKKWLAETDALVEKCQYQQHAEAPDGNNMPQPVPFFERNLEVWRQLWRVCEISQIILLLLDSRCPLLHYPSSLRAYLGSRKVVLVLTKVDISGPDRSDAWVRYLHAQFPDLPIVKVEAYSEKLSPEHQGRKQYEPHLPDSFRHNLVNALRDSHAELLEPPDRIKSDEARTKAWRPPVKRDVDWNAVLNADGVHVGTAVGGATVPRPSQEDEDRLDHDLTDKGDQEPKILTIGLIGQPNVGKSSLLNALFGVRRVRASKTPGKTKHFQTLYWTDEVRLVDCPGLVMPNYEPMEMQVLSGVLPISRISAIPACVYYASQRLPLEEIFRLTHPNLTASPVEDKRTWRDGMKPTMVKEKPLSWTAMDILTAFAEKKGWVTAKAGRPDINRAGNAILRALAEAKVRWAFWPPDTDVEDESFRKTCGLWIPSEDQHLDEDDYSSYDEAQGNSDGSNVTRDDSDDSEGEDHQHIGLRPGMFAALSIDNAEASDESSDEFIPLVEAGAAK